MKHLYAAGTTRFTDASRKAIAEYVHNQIEGKGAPCCDDPNWAFADSMVWMPLFRETNIVKEVNRVNAGTPAIVLLCDKCGTFRLVSPSRVFDDYLDE